ncbi:MAG: iron-containing alcohol dehydrogenase [Exilispira sp.]
MENFHLTMPTHIYFGKDQVKKLKKELSQYKKILLVAGGGSIKKNNVYNDVISVLDEMKIKVIELWGVVPNPDIDKVREGINLIKENDLHFILAVGGGSVIDTAKAIAAGFYYQGDCWELFYDEKKVQKALLVGVVLTLPATGSETNGNSVISNRKTCEKLAIHSDILRPKFAILDPSYTYTLPDFQTAAGSADIMAHVFEQYFSKSKAFMIDRIAESILRTVIKYTPVALKDPYNYEARSELMYASTLALNGLLSSGKITDWATHAMEHEISATHDITHGQGLAILFPKWMKYCYSEENSERFIDYAKNVWGIFETDRYNCAMKAIDATAKFFKEIGLKSSLSEYNIDQKYIDIWTDAIIKRRKSIGSFKVLFEQDIKAIYKASF